MEAKLACFCLETSGINRNLVREYIASERSFTARGGKVTQGLSGVVLFGEKTWIPEVLRES